MMPMYFFFSDKVVLLFDFWNVHSPAGMVLSVLVIMLLAVLYEAIKVGRAKLLQRTMPALAPSLSQETLEEPERASMNTGTEQLASTPKKKAPGCERRRTFPDLPLQAAVLPAKMTQQGRLFLWHSTQTLLHVVQVVLGYLVMLAVMSYNVWIFLGVIVGSAIGYYVAYPLLNTR